MRFEEFKNGMKNEFQKTGCWLAGVTKRFIHKAEDDAKGFMDDIVHEEEEVVDLFMKGMEDSNKPEKRNGDKEEIKEKEGAIH